VLLVDRMGESKRDEPSAHEPSSFDVERLLQPQRKLIASLMRSDARRQGDLATAFRQVTEVATQVLHVERASVWRLDESRTRIDCVDLFERSKNVHTSGVALVASEFPAYFAALHEERTITAHEARVDPRTHEFDVPYLRPNGIFAMLDAPIFVHGGMAGVVCHEHVGSDRRWQLWEELVAGTLADFVALVMEAERRVVAEAELEDHRAHLEQLVEKRTAELHRTEENLRRLFAASPVPLVLTGLTDQRVRYANRRASEVFELPLQAAKGQNAPDFYVDPEDRKRLLQLLRTERRIDSFETRLKTASGREFWGVLSAQRVKFEGEPCVLVGFYDITAQKNVEAALREQATRDGLTGVYNRRYFYELAARERDRVQRYRRPMSLAMIDADHFKQINDRHGHGVGDEVLRALAETCAKLLRRNDVLARWGGEEFVVLFPETDLAEATVVTERLREAIGRAPFDTAAGPVSFTISGGVVQLASGEETVEALIERADTALYSAKQQGRNRICTSP